MASPETSQLQDILWRYAPVAVGLIIMGLAATLVYRRLQRRPLRYAHPRNVRFAVLLAAAGAFIIEVGLLGDALGWWQERGFLGDVVASAGAAFISIPIGLVIISELTIQGQRHREVLELREILEASAGRFHDAVDSLVRVGRTPSDLESAIRIIFRERGNGDAGASASVAAWSREFVSPLEAKHALGSIEQEWALLQSLKADVYRIRHAWLTAERESAVNASLADIRAFLHADPFTSWAPDMPTAYVNSRALMYMYDAAYEINHLRVVSRMVRDTFAFAE